MAAPELLSSIEAFENFLSTKTGGTCGLKVVHFKSDWSEPCKTMTDILSELKADPACQGVEYAEINAEDLPHISMKYVITAVPTVLMFSDGKEVERVDGLRKEKLSSFIKAFVSNPTNPVTASPVTVNKPKEEKKSLDERLTELVNKNEIMVFMKGNPATPRCGFSRTLMGILKETGLPFGTFDILEDEEVRQGLKTFSNWQTYPQVYVKGELIGGLDIINELKESGELLSSLKGEN